MRKLQRILYVEDDADIRAIARLALETVGGFNVKTCASGEDALLEINTFDPDLLLLDVMMPGMDGPSTLNELRKLSLLAEVPVVFITAKAQSFEIDHLKSLGAQAVITKPFDPLTLAEQLTTIWHQRS